MNPFLYLRKKLCLVPLGPHAHKQKKKEATEEAFCLFVCLKGWHTVLGELNKNHGRLAELPLI